MMSFIYGCQRWYAHGVTGYGFGISLLGSFMKRVFMLLIFIQLVCCSIKDIYLMGIHKIKWKYIWNFGFEVFGGTAAFPEHCRSAVVGRAFHCHKIALSTSPLIFSLLSPYVFQAIVTVNSPERNFCFHHWTYIIVTSKCLNFYELYLIWLNTTEGLFGSLLFPFYFPNKLESGFFFFLSALMDFAVWPFSALLPNGLSWYCWKFFQAI